MEQPRDERRLGEADLHGGPLARPLRGAHDLRRLEASAVHRAAVEPDDEVAQGRGTQQVHAPGEPADAGRGGGAGQRRRA